MTCPDCKLPRAIRRPCYALEEGGEDECYANLGGMAECIRRTLANRDAEIATLKAAATLAMREGLAECERLLMELSGAIGLNSVDHERHEREIAELKAESAETIALLEEANIERVGLTWDRDAARASLATSEQRNATMAEALKDAADSIDSAADAIEGLDGGDVDGECRMNRRFARKLRVLVEWSAALSSAPPAPVAVDPPPVDAPGDERLELYAWKTIHDGGDFIVRGRPFNMESSPVKVVRRYGKWTWKVFGLAHEDFAIVAEGPADSQEDAEKRADESEARIERYRLPGEGKK